MATELWSNSVKQIQFYSLLASVAHSEIEQCAKLTAPQYLVAFSSGRENQNREGGAEMIAVNGFMDAEARSQH